MTVEACINFCDARSFVFAGAEFGQECCKLALAKSFICGFINTPLFLQTAGTLSGMEERILASLNAIWHAPETPGKVVVLEAVSTYSGVASSPLLPHQLYQKSETGTP